jgi:hypothetical protein
MEEVCQQQMPKSSSYRLNGNNSRHSMNGKNKYDSTHYYSTSSGGSLNGHTSIQKNRSEQIAHQKMSKTAEKKI